MFMCHVVYRQSGPSGRSQVPHDLVVEKALWLCVEQEHPTTSRILCHNAAVCHYLDNALMPRHCFMPMRDYVFKYRLSPGTREDRLYIIWSLVESLHGALNRMLHIKFMLCHCFTLVHVSVSPGSSGGIVRFHMI